MDTKKKQVSKKNRFEVFKRDSFTCQYCGKQAPAVVLHVDHIKPVASGGTNELMNLVCSCSDCNLGKGPTELADNSIIAQQKEQLNELNEKRVQLEMLIEWRESMKDIGRTQVEYIDKLLYGGTTKGLNDLGQEKIGKLIKKYGFDEVCTAAEKSRSNYSDYGSDGNLTEDSAAQIFDYVGRIAATERRAKDNPEIRDLFYIRAIVRNRMFCKDRECLSILQEAHDSGISVDILKDIAKTARNWTEWKQEMQEEVDNEV